MNNKVEYPYLIVGYHEEGFPLWHGIASKTLEQARKEQKEYQKTTTSLVKIMKVVDDDENRKEK